MYATVKSYFHILKAILYASTDQMANGELTAVQITFETHLLN